MWCVDGVARKLCARWNVLNSSPTDCRVWTRSSLDIHLPFRRGRVRATAMYIAKLVHIARTHSTGLLLSLAAQCTVHKVGPPWGINKVQPSTKPIQSIRPSSFLPAPSLIHSRFVLFYFIWAVLSLWLPATTDCYIDQLHNIFGLVVEIVYWLWTAFV